MNAAITSGIVVLLVLLFMVIVLAKTVRIVPQAQSQVVERLGRYSRTLSAGLHILVPFVDRVTSKLDLREQVVTFQPQPVITEDNLVVSIDSVIYFQVTDPKAATYEIQNYIWGVEQLTVTTLRNVVGSMDLEATLTSRDQINSQLRGVLDEATGKWGSGSTGSNSRRSTRRPACRSPWRSRCAPSVTGAPRSSRPRV
ncbi:MAG: paraslipin [Candidatus Nanopelagicales bacterium]